MPVRSDICREITKRRVYSHRKDEKTGKVKKRKNPSGTSSPFGWGTVTDSFMLNVKIWDNVRRNVDLYVKQIDTPTYLESSIVSVPKRVEQPKKKKQCVSSGPPPMIQHWYAQCDQNLKSGSVGLVPDCWSDRDSMPPLEELMVTQVGQVIKHFSQYIKHNF